MSLPISHAPCEMSRDSRALLCGGRGSHRQQAQTILERRTTRIAPLQFLRTRNSTALDCLKHDAYGARPLSPFPGLLHNPNRA